MRRKNYMNKLIVPNSFEECKTVEEAVAFCMANGHDKYEAYEMVSYAFHDTWSNDIFKRSTVTIVTGFDWF